MANKTVETSEDVAGFIAGIADAAQRADAEALIAMMADASGEPPAMWGSSIVGFGRYHYRYDSGREGDAARISFSPRKGKTVLYAMDGFPSHPEMLARLGKHKTGTACLYIAKLADVDAGVLRELVDASLAEMARHYPKE